MNENNIIGATYATSEGKSFSAINPSTGLMLEGNFRVANTAQVEEALMLAESAFTAYKNVDKASKAKFLRTIAEEITALGETLVNRAVSESGLPVGRLQGEVGRTVGQLNLFAKLVEEGSWVNAIIDHALPERQPLPRPDIRRMLIPIGPVVVFGASNFPLAFSVAGGDTASALASGCPVIVKAHPAHLGTSALVAGAIVQAVAKCGMPKGVFSMLYDDGYTIGEQLVKHPFTQAVAFTGSFRGGMALMKMAQEREKPIPVFAEMGSINPIIFLPQAIATKAEELAHKYAASITLGAGQFCTNPGLLLAIESPELDKFKETLANAISAIPSATMLTSGIYQNYNTLSEEVSQVKGIKWLAQANAINGDLQNQSVAKVAVVSGADFLANPKLHEEIFGPYSLLVVAENSSQLQDIIQTIGGQLTVTVMSENQEIANYPALVSKLSEKTGRLILNGVPTGVEVCAAMQHGGPFPATSDSRFTSVGSTAIYRFVRPIAFQDWDDSLLPDELKQGNPLGIFRLIDQTYTKD
ncbi:aldehyde dehydrogenase (NADP(+)) [Pedobacter insulae]|uniref:NADP-dependent aldehyde dehydrogenase n=1 Tax=Pedobacter insulae TaxID=414048 RepID=A0A1I2V0L8_9SPHI|nr:aldehyde dehydrogenase (NADP(+)) [Pedobacter insulae]SFG82693.1 NADP-dependent aldehyde dehydrogenase [Pedobacter insulae]